MVSIGKSSGENVVAPESEAWNIADGYTKIKILRSLIQLDIDQEVAKFGRSENDREQISFEEIPLRRIEGFNKLVFHLKQLIGNCHFSIEKGKDEKIVQSFINRIDQVEKHADKIANYVVDDVTKQNQIEINEEHFKTCFDILWNIKDEINFPINHAGLIFRKGDEINIDDFMKSVYEG